ncbi:MAG: carboxymethylenebutenolidase [Candidatus Tectimicrobiota bacterium]|nr:MAG: carboxymethylenebutenolidase [Candidatus Tectomicrobia bacterium]
MAAHWETLHVDGQPMRAYVSMPDVAGPHPGVVVIMEAFGVNGHMQRVTDRFAREGYVAVCPDLYHRQGPDVVLPYGDPRVREVMGRLRDDEIIKDCNAAIAYLQQNPQVTDKIGIVGYCVGGRISYLMACVNPALAAAVVYYGGRIFVPFGEGPAPIERTAGIQCPILGLFGALDQNPSVEDVRNIEAALKQAGKTYQFHIYEGADHGFNCDERASYHPQAAADAWQKTLAWFATYLKGA